MDTAIARPELLLVADAVAREKSIEREEVLEARVQASQKARLAKLSGSDIVATSLAGEPITATLSAAPGNGAALGGVKVESATSWFAARPSGTENVYKIYAESFAGPEQLATVQAEAKTIVDAALHGGAQS